MRKFIAILSFICLLSLAGCGTIRQQPETSEPDVSEASSEATPAEEPEETEEVPSEEPEETEDEIPSEDPFADMGGYDDDRVVNNGTYFVKIGNDIIYRAEGEDTICSSVMGHSFLKEPGPDVSSMGAPKRAKLMRLHTDIGKQEEICEDRGYGKLYYCDGMIYTNVYDTEEGIQRVFATRPDGSSSEELCEGSVTTISDDGEYLIITVFEGNEYYHRIYKGDHFVGDLKVENAAVTTFCGTSGDHVFVMSSDYDTGGGSSYTLWSADLSSPGDMTNLGKIPVPRGGEGAYDAGWPDITQALADGDVGYFSVSFYEGSGSFYQDGSICRADLYVEDSLKLIRDAITTGEEFGSENYMWLDRGELQVGFGIPFRALYDRSLDSILLYDETATARVAKENVLGAEDPDTLIYDNIEEVYYIDGEYYMVRHKYMDDPAAAVGWRSVCDRLDTKYERIDLKGETTILYEVGGSLEKNGNIAKGDDKSLYYITEGIYHDKDHVSGELGRGDLTDEGAKALEKLMKDPEHDIPVLHTSSVSSNGYRGLDAAEDFEDISEGMYTMTFNSEGKIINIKPAN